MRAQGGVAGLASAGLLPHGHQILAIVGLSSAFMESEIKGLLCPSALLHLIRTSGPQHLPHHHHHPKGFRLTCMGFVVSATSGPRLLKSVLLCLGAWLN